MIRLHYAQLTVPVGEEERARAFYCGVMGLHEISKPESLAGRGGFWVALGDIQIHIGTEDGFDRTRTNAHLAYEVEDVSAWRAKVEGAGCKVLDSVPIPGFDRFEFRDPFGNRVEIIAPRA